MKMKIIRIFLLAITVITSCSVHYDVNHLTSDEPECIIVNSVLNPANQLQVQLYKLQKEDNRYSYSGLEGAKITIKEGEKIIYDDVCEESVLNMDYFPKVNRSYSIEASFDNLETVKASTQIPPAITCESGFRSGEYYWDVSAYVIELNTFVVPATTERISLWITSYQVYQDDEEVQYNELYTNNAFVDKTNSVVGMPILNDAVGSIYHNGFLRVRNKNLQHLEELVFTPNYVLVENAELPSSQQTNIKVKIITASAEYDQFAKSLYEQKSIFVDEGSILSIFFQPQTVYSNIENGLGIFAGMNEVNQMFDMPIKDY